MPRTIDGSAPTVSDTQGDQSVFFHTIPGNRKIAATMGRGPERMTAYKGVSDAIR